MMLLSAIFMAAILTTSSGEEAENESDESRKILGSSVVTSVSVIMDAGNGSQAVFADALGKPVDKPSTGSQLASPINLLNPDRYEFYTFDDSGDLVKRLMTLDEIQGIIANGDGGEASLMGDWIVMNPGDRVDDVVSNVQNVLKQEIEVHSKKQEGNRPFDTPDVSSSWSMILPAIFGNSGEDIKPQKTASAATPETYMVEPTTEVTTTPNVLQTINALLTSLQPISTITRQSITTRQPVLSSRPSTTTKRPLDTSLDNTKQATITIKPIPTTKKPLTTTIVRQPIDISTSTKQAMISKKPATNKPKPIHNEFKDSQYLQLPLLSTHSPSTTIKPDIVTDGGNFELLSSSGLSTTRPVLSSSTVVPSASSQSPLTPSVLLSSSSMSSVTQGNTPQSSLSSSTTQKTQSLPSALLLSSSSSSPVLSTSPSTQPNPLSSSSSSSTTTEHTTPEQTVTKWLSDLLLTTNVYQINSELFDKTTTDIDSSESTTTTSQQTTFDDRHQQPTTTDISTTTSDNNLISSIEQLISQTMVNVDNTIDNQKESEKVQEILSKPSVGEAATVMSNIVSGPQNDEISSTDGALTMVPDEAVLSQSVGDLISQIVGNYPSLSGVGEDKLERQDELELKTTTASERSETSTVTESTTVEDVSTVSTEEAQTKTTVSEDLSQTTEVNAGNNSETTTYLYVIADNKLSLKDLLLSTTVKEDKDTTTNAEITTESETTTTITTTTIEDDISTIKSVNKINDSIPKTPNTTIEAEEPTTTEQPQTTITQQLKQQNLTWALVSTISPHSPPTTSQPPPSPLPTPQLDGDVKRFVDLCNELAFGFWKSITTGISTARSVFTSPFAATSLLSMVFLGARGATSGEMNEILRLDDMVTFNPHLFNRNVTESSEETTQGVATSGIVRELFCDAKRGKLLGFYKERVRQFYDGHVEEVDFAEVGDVIRRRTNMLVKRKTGGKGGDFIKETIEGIRSPLAAISASLFQTDCTSASTTNRDGELYFVVSPTIRQRRLIPIPAVVYHSDFLAGYEPTLDATAVCLSPSSTVSTILLMPGQQGASTPGDSLRRLETDLTPTRWSRVLRTLVARHGLHVQIPRFSHRSVLNATSALRRMGLDGLFDEGKADLRGLLTGGHELFLSEVLQVNSFATCGEGRGVDAAGVEHHSEVYPASGVVRVTREVGVDEGVFFGDPLAEVPLELRPRQARVPEAPRLKFDRPFLYFVRHNPSGLILHMGRFNPRLLP